MRPIRLFAAAAIVADLCIAISRYAQTKVIVGYTATIDVAPLFVAIDKGYFQKRGS